MRLTIACGQFSRPATVSLWFGMSLAGAGRRVRRSLAGVNATRSMHPSDRKRREMSLAFAQAWEGWPVFEKRLGHKVETVVTVNRGPGHMPEPMGRLVR